MDIKFSVKDLLFALTGPYSSKIQIWDL